ncbi:helix-turn-helix transcriptional regulator [Streptomyces sp. NPDC049954]|uniref:helix-turn-helix domain-containing protein n=1 Tax=Streptomyces sp. NPDC049954 TaxID=3155779 RepID=UPI0034399CF3
MPLAKPRRATPLGLYGGNEGPAARSRTPLDMIGALLAHFRRAAGHTQEGLAELAGISRDTIASIEQGRRLLQGDTARKLDALLDTKGALSVAVDNLPSVETVVFHPVAYMEVEALAIAVDAFENQVLPGLLQTEAYATGVLRAHAPAFPEDVFAHHLAVRMGRKEILRRPAPPNLTFIIWEPVLHAPHTAEAEHAAQLRHLLDCARLPRVTVQILPLSSRRHAGLGGAFSVLEMPDHRQLAYVETQRRSTLSDEPENLSILKHKYAMLRTQALNVDDSLALIAQACQDDAPAQEHFDTTAAGNR